MDSTLYLEEHGIKSANVKQSAVHCDCSIFRQLGSIVEGSSYCCFNKKESDVYSQICRGGWGGLISHDQSCFAVLTLCCFSFTEALFQPYLGASNPMTSRSRGTLTLTVSRPSCATQECWRPPASADRATHTESPSLTSSKGASGWSAVCMQWQLCRLLSIKIVWKTPQISPLCHSLSFSLSSFSLLLSFLPPCSWPPTFLLLLFLQTCCHSNSKLFLSLVLLLVSFLSSIQLSDNVFGLCCRWCFRYHVLGLYGTTKIPITRENCALLLEKLNMTGWALGKTKVLVTVGLSHFTFAFLFDWGSDSFILWFMCSITASRTDSFTHFAHLFILFILWLAHSLTLIDLFSHSLMYLVTHAVTCLFVHSFVYAFIYSFMFVCMKLCSSVCQSPWCL